MLERVWRKRKHCWWDYELVQPLWRAIGGFLKKLKQSYYMILQSHSWASIQRKP